METLKTITPLRYVFYVGHPDERERILRNGIQIEKKNLNDSISEKPNGIFVYNEKSIPDYSWYPFVFFDYYDWELANCYESGPLKMYDFWRIDTSKIKNKWFKDQWYKREFEMLKDFEINKNYIYTDTEIPLNALKLFRFQQEKFYFTKGEKGTTHVKYIGEFRPYNAYESFL